MAEIRNQIANELLSRKHQVKSSNSPNGRPNFIVVTTKLVEQLGADADGTLKVDKESISVLQIRSVDGKTTLVLKMWATDRVADVYEALQMHFLTKGGHGGGDFVLQSQYPRRIFTTAEFGQQTLREAGLTPRAMLRMVQQTPSPSPSLVQETGGTTTISSLTTTNSNRSRYTSGHVIVPSPPHRPKHTQVAVSEKQQLDTGPSSRSIALNTDDPKLPNSSVDESTQQNVPRGSGLNVARGPSSSIQKLKTTQE